MSKKSATTSQSSGKKKFFQKRIPTIIGLGVLLVALVSGVLFFSQGTGVFAPRATPQSTPKKIRLTNVTDAGFTVSFITDEPTTGFIKYGTESNQIKSQASDDRDQLSGAVNEYNTHHITVRGLEPNTTYYYTLGTGGNGFDNNGQPFEVKTAQRTGVPSAANTIYGSVVTNTGNPADGAIVYAAVAGAGEMSSLVKSSGSWAIPLATARTTDGTGYAQITDTDSLTLLIQGNSTNLTSQVTAIVANAQPVANITLGESLDLATMPTETSPPVSTDSAQVDTEDEATSSGELDDTATIIDDATDSAKTRGGLSDLVDEETAFQTVGTATLILDLEAAAATSSAITVSTSQPVIKGKAVPNVKVSIQVNSDTQINQDVTADADGNFELDLAELGEDLEPGEHTVVYSYVDPNTGKTVSETVTFYVDDSGNIVDDTSNLIAQADTTEEDDAYPYGSSNPYPASASSTATDSTKTATDSAVGTRSAQVSTTSAIPVSGSVGTTYALILGGLFFILAGSWSWWIANNLEEELA